MQTYEQLYIGGQWVAPAGSGRMEVISPTSEEAIAQVPDVVEADIDRAVAAAREAFDHGPWPRMSPSERADVMERISKGLEARIPEMAQTITREMGSPIGFSMAGQAFAPKMVLDYYTQLARSFEFEEPRGGTLGGRVLVRREPVGVCGLIIPWNVPLYVTMLKLSPALASGSTAVVKAAPRDAPQWLSAGRDRQRSGPARGRAEHPARPARGLRAPGRPPRGGQDRLHRQHGGGQAHRPALRRAAQALHAGTGREIGRHRLRRRRPGRLHPAAAPGRADEQRPGLHRPDAHPGRRGGATPRWSTPWSNRWARCGSATRWTSRPACGPLFAERQRERVEGYIGIGRDEGAKLALGGGRPEGLERGWFVEPTIFSDVDNRMRIAREEIFGPVLAVIPYEDEDDAVRIANDSDYGLSGSVWTSDVERGTEIGRRVRTGTYGVNQVGMDFGAPFGGFKQSGIGRELGPEGLSAYLEAKTILLPA